MSNLRKPYKFTSVEQYRNDLKTMPLWQMKEIQLRQNIESGKWKPQDLEAQVVARWLKENEYE